MAKYGAYGAAATLGVVAGMRSLTPLALLSLGSQRGSLTLRRSPLPFLRSRQAAIAAAALAGLELVGDKLPNTPDRTRILPLAARLASGALCGAAICTARHESAFTGALLGAAGAAAGTYAAFALRGTAVRNAQVPPLLAAFVEDALALGSGSAAVFARY